MINIIWIFYGWLGMAIIMSGLWIIQKRYNNPSIVDPMWAIGLLLLTLFYAVVVEGDTTRKCIIAILVTIWSLRLSLHLIIRIKKLSEDGRYTDMRARWQSNANFYFFIFFQVQAFWSVLFSIAPLIAMLNPKPINIFDFIGIGIWLFAILGETVADAQLSKFRNNPANKGKVCKSGFWYYSRHPNYFFEWLHWWAYVALANYLPLGIISLLGPSIMLYFLLNVTGVPPTEAQSLRSRGDAYRQYQRTTNKFFPWLPKN